MGRWWCSQSLMCGWGYEGRYPSSHCHVLCSQGKVYIRDYWMIYRGQAFSRSNDLAPLLAPSPHHPVSKLARRHTGRLRNRDNLLTGDGGEEFGLAEAYNRKKAFSSTNHSILSGVLPFSSTGRNTLMGRGQSSIWSVFWRYCHKT